MNVVKPGIKSFPATNMNCAHTNWKHCCLETLLLGNTVAWKHGCLETLLLGNTVVAYSYEYFQAFKYLLKINFNTGFVLKLN